MAEKPPNIVLILSDDHGYADRGRLGINPGVNTPGLDRIAAEGVECTQGYVTAPVCSPSRAGLIAGQYQARWGGFWFNDSAFPAHLPSLAERFRDLGYATAYLGKVHYGTSDEVHGRSAPPHHGFAESYYAMSSSGRVHYLRHSQAAMREYGAPAARINMVQPMLEGDAEVELEGFLTDELGARARRFVTAQARAGRPFFCMLAFNAVHNFCWQLPRDELEKRGLPTCADYAGDGADYLDWYDGHISPNLDHGRDYYLAQLELMDAQIGHLLNALDEQQIAEDTLVVYLTDNGGSTCNFADNAPLRGTKYTLWEGGIRVPFLWRWPAGRLPRGQRRDGMISALDLYPTLLAAAGADPGSYQHCDGRNQLQLLRDDAPGHEALHWDTEFQWAVRRGDWKLAFVDTADARTQGVRDVEHAEPGAGYRLFNLAADPAETTNLVDEKPKTVAELRTLHEQWRTDVTSSAAAIPE